ncbi:MAG: PqiC family protein [Solimonas sp.]
MIRRQTRRLALSAGAAAALLLAACSGDDPTRFYTLVRPVPATPAVAGQAAFAIDVQPVRVPAQVNQPELVVRQGDGEVALVESRRWIAPLPDEVRGAIAAEVGAGLGARDVSQVAPPDGVPVYRILVDLQRFDAQIASDVRIEAVWTVIDVSLGAKARWTCATSVTTPVGPGYGALVDGAQQGLAKVSADIAALIRGAQQDRKAVRCAS